MARWQFGAENNSLTTEVDSVTGSPTVVTSPYSGIYAMNSNVTATTAFITQQYAAVGNTSDTHFQFRFMNRTAPGSGNTAYFLLRDATNGNNIVVRYSAFGVMIVTDEQAGGGQIGGNSGGTGIARNRWYTVTGSYIYSTGLVTIKLDGVTFCQAQGTANVESDTIRLGLIDSTTADVLFDDVVVSDSPIGGNDRIIHYHADSAGDSNGFATQVGGTAGSSNNFTRVNETTPDDATSYNASATLNAEDMFGVENLTIGAYGTISAVGLGARFTNLSGADATTAIKFQLMKQSGGTKSQSSAIIPNSTSWLTNAPSAPATYPLMTTATPDGEEWSRRYLDSMQGGYIITAAGVQAIAVSNLWWSIAYTDHPQGTTTSSTSSSISSTSISSTSSSISTSSTSFSSTSTSTSTSVTTLSTSSTSSSISSTSASTSSTSISSTSSSTSLSSTSSSISSTSFSSTSMSSTSSSSSLSSTSSSISSTSSSISSTSRSTSSTSFSSTSSSSSTSTTAIPLNLDYTYQDTLTVPTTGADDIDIDTNKNYMNVSVDDGDYFIQYGSEYMIQEFKKKWTNNTDNISFIWKGRSTLSTVTSPLLIQVYNVNSATWETLAREKRMPADFDFTLRALVTQNVSNYYDSNNVVTFRSYQQVI